MVLWVEIQGAVPGILVAPMYKDIQPDNDLVEFRVYDSGIFFLFVLVCVSYVYSETKSLFGLLLSLAHAQFLLFVLVLNTY